MCFIKIVITVQTVYEIKHKVPNEKGCEFSVNMFREFFDILLLFRMGMKFEL